MTNDRTIRDRLAEALVKVDWQTAIYRRRGQRTTIDCLAIADDFLASLPSVGLTLSIQPHQNDGGEG